MFFFFYSYFFALLIPATMLLFGWLWKKKPPKDINALYGYRTSMSTKNQETWNFAHQKIGALWRRIGTCLVVLTLLGFPAGSLLLAKENALSEPQAADAMGWLLLALVGVQLVVLVASIFPVERALKRAFNEDGQRRM